MNKTYRSSRLTSGNLVFPDILTLTDNGIDFQKRRWFGSDHEHINYKAVASVRISSGILFSTLEIETSGGSQPIVMNGVDKSTAREIQAAIVQHGARPADS